MEWFGYALIFGLFLFFLFGSSSDWYDHRGRHSGRRSDFWDDDDDYYDYPPHWPPPYRRYRRRSRFGGLLIGFFLGILVFAAVVGGVAGTVLKGSTTQIETLPPPKPTKVVHPADYDYVPEVNVAPPPKPPRRKLERQPHDRMMKLAKTDPVSLRQIQQTYPERGYEGYRDHSTGQIWVVIFGTSESLNDIGLIMTERAEDLKERGLVFTITVYSTNQVCPDGNVVREEGTDIWFCDMEN